MAPANRRTPASEVATKIPDVVLRLERDAEFLCNLSTKEFNDIVRQEDISMRAVDALKKKRRMLKNKSNSDNRKLVIKYIYLICSFFE